MRKNMVHSQSPQRYKTMNKTTNRKKPVVPTPETHNHFHKSYMHKRENWRTCRRCVERRKERTNKKLARRRG